MEPAAGGMAPVAEHDPGRGGSDAGADAASAAAAGAAVEPDRPQARETLQRSLEGKQSER
jgi:hypothetical protein